MSKVYTLKAEARERVGKGSSRHLRRNGLVPAVIYGDKKPALSIALPYKDIFYKIHGGAFFTTIASIEVGNEKIEVLPTDYQLDPVRDFPMHVDFLRVTEKSVVHVNVPVHFINEEQAPGIKTGGVLNIVRHEVEFAVPAHNIPEAIEADLTGREVGDSIHISDIKLPEGVSPVIKDRDFTIATIAAPVALPVEDETPAPEEAATTEATATAETEEKKAE
ncbi:50S ribosomal protein L25/general stress protein Ctc [uncultured Bartonella sp.]|uniref:50S ribosomal protein L25/general stress protein Ctc n=1 Tax=uncultured Bartonella sp. TaxID=104108 RepID=UPI0025E2CFF7|nr:50S ribosomal protein L25/general stress protein Ctc [uncultured Bartonella sp.]